MKGLLRLYPRSWRRRYGAEMEDLVDTLPPRPAVALDLLVGAAAAYAAVVRANRILCTAGAFLHGLCVAVLVQGIAFVTMVLFTQSWPDTRDIVVGPFAFATVYHAAFLDDELHQLMLAVRISDWLPGVALLLGLAIALVAVISVPRLLRSVR
jgi:hypothetical protein